MSTQPIAVAPPPLSADLRNRRFWSLSLLTLGVVYGDIGTSPLYALKECFHKSHGLDATDPANVLGVLSLVTWSLILLISIKYLVFVLRADNRGEGGMLALMSLLTPSAATVKPWRQRIIITLGLIGAALLYGDGMITPVVSIFGAVEGLHVATDRFDDFVVPITVVILIGLFTVQRHGTARIGAAFGPIMVVWFITLAVLGVASLVQEPKVLAALNPWHGAMFFVHNGWTGYFVLGSVFLCVTGGEALYADMGHFGPRPIRVVWYGLVLPSLLLNYYGQGALLLRDPAAVENPFYALAPSWGLYPLVVLATAAAVIASQALISGVFSLTMQAVQLGYVPRMSIEHTSESHFGQIFIAPINLLLMLGTIGLAIGFGSSSNIAAAYGLSVNLDMVITTILLFSLAYRVWGWKPWVAGGLCGVLLVIELAFLGANASKIAQGGWFPLAVAAAIFAIVTTWKRGRALSGDRIRRQLMPLDKFIKNMADHPPLRVEGTAVFLTGNPHGVPLSLVHNLKHNKVLHKRVILLSITTDDVATVPHTERVEYKNMGDGFHQVVAHYGFMESPHIPTLLNSCTGKGLCFSMMETTFFLGRETLLAGGKGGMARWRKKLFSLLSRNAQPPSAYFHIPPNRVIEVGAQIEL